MKTIAEAVDEFHGLANEAERFLQEWVFDPEMEPIPEVIHQLVELAASALTTCQNNEARMRDAVRALTGQASEPNETPEGTEGTPEGS